LTDDEKKAYVVVPRAKGEDIKSAKNAPSTKEIVAFFPPPVKGIERTTQKSRRGSAKKIKIIQRD